LLIMMFNINVIKKISDVHLLFLTMDLIIKKFIYNNSIELF